MKTQPLFLIPLLVGLTACESSQRLNGMFGTRSASVASQPIAEPASVSAPTSPVSAEPLAPLDGVGQPGVVTAQALPASGGAEGATVVEPLQGQTASAAGAVEVAPVVAPATGPTARGVSGNWRISDAGRGTSCTMLLTQTALLDLFRAKPTGCQASSLAKVNAWEQRGQEVVLIEPGGKTAVRLFPKGDGSYEGAATTSGAVVRMTRG